MHLIRLRGPWELEPLARFGRDEAGGLGEVAVDLPPGGRTDVPGDWASLLGADFCGRVRYRRAFHAPTNLEPAERVWLVLEGIDPQAAVALNDRPLGRLSGRACPHRLDITPHLLPRNVLSVEVCLEAGVFDDAAVRGSRAGRAGGLVGEVRLEIARSGDVC